MLYYVYVLIEQSGGALLYVKATGRLAARMPRAFQLESMEWANWHSNYERAIHTMNIAKLPTVNERETSKVLLKQSLEKEHQKDGNNDGPLSERDRENLKPCSKTGSWIHTAVGHSSRKSHQNTTHSWQGC